MDDFEEVDHPGAVDTLFQATPPLHQVKMFKKSPIKQTNKIVKWNEYCFHGFFSKILVTKEASLCISTTISSHNNYNYDDDLDDLRGLEETTTAT